MDRLEVAEKAYNVMLDNPYNTELLQTHTLGVLIEILHELRKVSDD